MSKNESEIRLVELKRESSLSTDDGEDYNDKGTENNQGSTDRLDSSVERAICSNSADVVNVVQRWLDSITESQNVKLNATNEDGKTALHLAAQCNNLKIAQLLLLAGADPSLLDEDRKLALHIVCSLPEDEDVVELVTALMEKNSPIGACDEDMNTPLHLSAKYGHLSVVRLLLNRGADMSVRAGDDRNGDTPVHIAVSAKHTEIVKEMIEREPSCVNFRGKNEQTPLHQAAEKGNFEIVQIILEARPDMNAKDGDGDTPLGAVAFSGSTQVAKLLIENGAAVNPPIPANKAYRNPFHKAAYFGSSDLASYLLRKGATVSAWAFQELVNEGYEEIAAAVVRSSQWPIALRRTYTDRGHETTPFRELIRKMPDVAEDVLNKCAVEDPAVQERGDEFYSVVYNYEFIEDFKDGPESGEDETDSARKNKKTNEETHGCGYFDILERDLDCEFHWGPLGFRKFHHPLAIMVRKKRLNLLSHPVIGSLLHHKWKAFGQYGYFFNLLTYFVFLMFLTAFALVVQHEPFCLSSGTPVVNITNSTPMTCDGVSDSGRNFLYLAPAVVILFALCRLLVEIAQLVSLKLSYVTDWVNWMEVTLFVCSIIFVWVYTNKCQCVLDWQWQIGVVAVFLGWIDLIIFISKFPLTGIYVLMFIKIFYTFLKMLVLTLLLVVAFGITFYMVLFDPMATRSPFSDAPRSLLKTMTMTTGELGYDDIFRFDFSADPGDIVEIAYFPITVILWIVFIVLMPILLTNMLVGLAVGDIEAIQKEAELQKLALQVEQVLTVEELLPKKLRKKFRITYIEVKPNSKNSKFINFITKVGFYIWGGDRYDSQECINRALHPSLDPNEEILQKTTRLVEEVEQISEMKQDLNELKNDIDEIKQDLRQYKELKSLVEEIARKHGINVPDPSIV